MRHQRLRTAAAAVTIALGVGALSPGVAGAAPWENYSSSAFALGSAAPLLALLFGGTACFGSGGDC